MKASVRVDTVAVWREVLAAAVPDLHRLCRDPWTLIGSAAARLAGAEVVVADLDVLTSVRDAETLIGHWKARRDDTYVPPGEDRFRSRFARFLFPGLPVEVMGGLELCGERGWELVRIDAIVMLDVAGLAVPIPAVTEQIRVLESFGRPKDLQRAALLKRLSEERQ
ncbi:hypothetical protein ASG75_05190 [Rhodanobacter sp. Soil772]|uniref:hypothetical protein n=1 Tax=Rhodanobacter sp. Soil772 TaxID=1736406 RepID=UPI0006FB15A3|nr:hypothetical protein [Rhodanobacter sp. Soil772]KRE87895.1 hypothetical protein ASG75_05190 [Rhodanobacter sp. Soil772]